MSDELDEYVLGEKTDSLIVLDTLDNELDGLLILREGGESKVILFLNSLYYGEICVILVF